VASEPILAPFDLPVAKRTRFRDSKIWFDYLALTKPEVNFLIVVSTFAGFYLGCPSAWHDFPFLRSINAVLGTLLVASGTGALNQYSERHFDAQMRRTARRPLAAGRLRPSAVLWFGIALSVLGAVYLAAAVNLLASLLALATLLSYLFLYTPLKRKSPLCTLVGAFSGAMPPLIGWAAASGRLSFGAWILYSALFLWQFPHFMAIAWLYREDYARAGYLVLPQDDRTRAHLVDWQTLLPLLLLAPISLLPVLPSTANIPYCIAALLLCIGFLYYGARFALQKSNSSARQLLSASILYLPSLFVLLILLRVHALSTKMIILMFHHEPF
jgi:heme o synthase